MGLFNFLKRLFTALAAMGRSAQTAGPRLSMAELTRRLGLTEEQLQSVKITYREFSILKRDGGRRRILDPGPQLKQTQRLILRRLLRRLPCHPAAHGFERGRSIVTNAEPHAGKSVVVKLDIKDFFRSTDSNRVTAYFRSLGWDDQAAALLTRICTYQGGLPPGAPTSPRLANLVNQRLDARLTALAVGHGPRTTTHRDPRTGTWVASSPSGREAACYTRYADDLTFSFQKADRRFVHAVIWFARAIVEDTGYELHLRKKLQIRRRHDRQVVTGLVVNQTVNLPRKTRRRLRAIEHQLRVGRSINMTSSQLAGWRSLQAMVARSAGPPRDATNG